MKLYKTTCINCENEVLLTEKKQTFHCPDCKLQSQPNVTEIIINNYTKQIQYFITYDDNSNPTKFTVPPDGKLVDPVIREVELSEYYPLTVREIAKLGLQGLPLPEENVYYIVTKEQAEFVRNRQDVLYIEKELLIKS